MDCGTRVDRCLTKNRAWRARLLYLFTAGRPSVQQGMIMSYTETVANATNFFEFAERHGLALVRFIPAARGQSVMTGRAGRARIRRNGAFGETRDSISVFLQASRD
jgi:hypothetical protein